MKLFEDHSASGTADATRENREPLKLTVEHLSASFGDRTILEDVSFEVKEGELVALIGQNASGKTTLVKSIAGLLPHGGRVVLSEYGTTLSRNSIAYLPQLTSVQSRLTVFEMVMLGLSRGLTWRVPPDVFDKVDETLHIMRINRLANRPVASLSGGQKQLVFMAQAFVSSPKLLLLDEPTSALDLRHQLIVMQAAKDYCKRTRAIGIVIVHDLFLASRFADKLLMLDTGLIRRFDAPENVLSEDDLARVYRVSVSVERTAQGFLSVVPLAPLYDAASDDHEDEAKQEEGDRHEHHSHPNHHDY